MAEECVGTMTCEVCGREEPDPREQLEIHNVDLCYSCFCAISECGEALDSISRGEFLSRIQRYKATLSGQ